MRLVQQAIEGLYLVETEAFSDERGKFYRGFCKREFDKHGVDFEVCQTNVSVNPTCYTLRGFHYQRPPSAEKKIITVVSGRIFHAVIDMRRESETFLQEATFDLSAEVEHGVLVPEGLASAFLTTAADTVVIYHMDGFYDPKRNEGLRYNDPIVTVEWPCQPVLVSERDLNFEDFESSHSGGAEWSQR